MEQPVTPLDSPSDFAPQKAHVLARQKDRQNDGTPAWQVVRRTHKSYKVNRFVTEWRCGLIGADRQGNSLIRLSVRIILRPLFLHNMLFLKLLNEH